MAREWTPEQRKVIDHRGSSLLVSAAAGSGKTAVLVERIIRMVTDPVHPVDIDRLLVVTFTRAAAGEMKDRLASALSACLAENPENEHLQQQSVLIHHAQITTIHGFCSYVIQNYFGQIHLDPSFRIADEGELKLLREDVMDELMEEEYAKEGEEGEAFRRFISAYSSVRDDRDAADMIQQVYTYSRSHPYPDEWLDSCLEVYRTGSSPMLEEQLMTNVRLTVSGMLETARQLAETAASSDELSGCAEVLQSDAAELAHILQQDTPDACSEAVRGVSLARWKGPRKGKASEEILSRAADLKKQRDDGIRQPLKNLRDRYFLHTAEQNAADLVFVYPYMKELVRLVRLFAEKFAEAKRARNIADFSDLEHYALEILEEKDENGHRVRTFAAKELASRFEEIMTDEYQDSSFLQEAILSDVSGEADGRNNRFMVGDIKQSIYGFRMAQPSLFLAKMHAYAADHEAEQRTDGGTDEAEQGTGAGTDEAEQGTGVEIDEAEQGTGAGADEAEQRSGTGSPATGHRIDLGKNFRSRPEVLRTVNAFFERLMIPELGGIRYGADQALYEGRDAYPQLPDPETAKSELLLIDRSREEFADFRSRNDRIALEAQAVGSRILSMVNSGTLISDKGSDRMRPVQFRDIVILLRSAQDWAETYVKTLQALGVPAFAPAKSGYFSAPEVRLVLDYLRILSNPQQDIPLTAVLRSPIVGLTDSELAEIRAFCPTGTYYYAFNTYLRAGEAQYGAGGNAPHEEVLPGAGGSVPHDTDRYDAVSDGDRADFADDHAYGYDANEACRTDDMTGADDATISQPVYDKLACFRKQLEDMRRRAVFTPVHTLIREILRETGYGEYAAAMPAGRQRQANLDMLVEKAAAYETTSYHGVFNFIRYIEKLEKYKVDDGEVNISGEDDDTVRVMTIHASKGLEFPIVFIAGLGKQFNKKDQTGPVLLHAEMGVGLKKIDLDRRTKGETILRRMISSRRNDEMLGEELRILYVAMTRAEQKLILAATVDKEETVEDFEAKQAEADQMRDLTGGQKHLRARRYDELTSAKGFSDWIRMAMPDDSLMTIREITGADLVHAEAEENTRVTDAVEKLRAETLTQDIHTSEAMQGIRRAETLTAEANKAEVKLQEDAKSEKPMGEAQSANDIRAFLERRDVFRYPYEAAAGLPAKMTVTEIKKRSAQPSPDEQGELLLPEEDESCVPVFMQENPDAEEVGAARGTVYHSFFEHLDYSRVNAVTEDETAEQNHQISENEQTDKNHLTPENERTAQNQPTTKNDLTMQDELTAQIREMTADGIFSPKEAECLRVKDFVAFLHTALGQRMKRAAEAGVLHREQPFVLDVPAKDIDNAWSAEENILVQGTIDAYFSEEDAQGEKFWVLVDYKTDRVKTRDGSDLVEKYAAQLAFYRRALEQITEIPVREMWIYSVTLSLAIPVGS